MSPAAARYQVDEVSPVSDEALQRLLNERAEEGWSFDSIHFAMREGSHRPSMAYVFFTRGSQSGGGSAADT